MPQSMFARDIDINEKLDVLRSNKKTIEKDLEDRHKLYEAYGQIHDDNNVMSNNENYCMIRGSCINIFEEMLPKIRKNYNQIQGCRFENILSDFSQKTNHISDSSQTRNCTLNLKTIKTYNKNKTGYNFSRKTTI